MNGINFGYGTVIAYAIGGLGLGTEAMEFVESYLSITINSYSWVSLSTVWAVSVDREPIGGVIDLVGTSDDLAVLNAQLMAHNLHPILSTATKNSTRLLVPYSMLSDHDIKVLNRANTQPGYRAVGENTPVDSLEIAQLLERLKTCNMTQHST